MQPLLNNWKKLTTGSLNRQIFSAAIKVGLMTVLVKVIAVGKELVVAWNFGTGDDLEAFFIAWLVPSSIVVILAESFNATMIPAYIQVREQENSEVAQRLLSGVTICSLGLLLFTTILMVIFAPLYLPSIARGFNSQKLHLTFQLLCTISPVVMLSGIIIIWSAILNAGERFILAAISPLITPLITLIFLLLYKNWGVFALTAGLVWGAILEAIVLGTALKRQGISIFPKWYKFDSHLRQVTSQYVPITAGAFLMYGTTIVDQSMAAMLSPGSVAALNYGSKLITLPMSLTATALSVAVVPYFSKMVALKDWTEVSNTLNRYLKIILAFTMPLTLGLILFSQPLVKLLLQRGEFTADDTYVVAQVQACYALQIPFYVAGILIVRAISSLRLNHILMWASGFNLIINIGLNYLFLQLFGVKGIALSTSCVMLFSFIYVWYFLNQGLGRIKHESR